MTAPPDTTPRVGVFTTDSDLVIRTWDHTLAAMTGISASDAQGQRLESLVPDVATRVPADVLREPLTSGAVRILAPALHRYLIPCPPSEPSAEFTHMQQRVAIGALRNDEEGIVGLMITVEDVTRRIERERQLARALRDGAPADRIAAVRELAALEHPDSLAPVHAALSDNDWQVRRSAVRAVSSGQSAALVQTVVTALRDGHRNFSLLSSALQLLSMTGLDVTDALISLMNHPDPDLRIQVALALGTQSREEASDALVAAFDDPDVNVRFHAIEAIGRRVYPAASGRLADLATSGDFFLAFPAIEALVRIGDPLVAPRLAALLTDGLLAAVTAQALGQIGDEDSIGPLVGALERPEIEAPPLLEAIVAIYQRYDTLFQSGPVIESVVNDTISDAATTRLVRELSRTSGASLKHAVIIVSWIRHDSIPAALAQQLGRDDARHEVVEALVRVGGPAVSHLIDALGSEDTETRKAAVVALGRLGDRQATPSLTRLLQDESARDLWVTVAGALARLGDRRAFDPLLERLADPDGAVRHAAIGALNSIGDPAMSARIIGMLDDDNALLRESAIRVAGYFGYAECADAVFARCSDRDAAVRTAALEHLPYFDDDRTVDMLGVALAGGSDPERAAAARALAVMPGAAERDLLTQALTDADPWVRYFSAIGLGRHGDAAGVEPLARHARSDTAMQVSVAAIEALAAIGTEPARLVLAQLAADNGPRGHAALRALGAQPSPAGLEVLRDALRSPDSLRRTIAVEALAVDGSESAVEALGWAAAGDTDIEVSRAALQGLRAVANRQTTASPGAVRALIDVLAGSSRHGDALDALSQLDGAAIPAFAEAMQAAAPPLRRTLVEALGRLSDPAATAHLRAALSDDEPQVRRTAIVALSRMGVAGLTARLVTMAQKDPSPAVQQAAFAALRRADAGPSGIE